MHYRELFSVNEEGCSEKELFLDSVVLVLMALQCFSEGSS